MPQEPYQLVFTTCPDAECARRIADTLVTEGLAACVSILSDAESVYRWQGEIQHDREHQLLIKTTTERFVDLRVRVLALHPYELPEVIGVPIIAGLEPYLAWLTHPEEEL